jgi:hypothetical protein
MVVAHCFMPGFVPSIHVFGLLILWRSGEAPPMLAPTLRNNPAGNTRNGNGEK